MAREKLNTGLMACLSGAAAAWILEAPAAAGALLVGALLVVALRAVT